MLARLTRDLPGFARGPQTAAQIAEVVRQRLAHRPERFLFMVQRYVYGNPRSPYRRLLRSVGCEPGDLASLVAADGVEGALSKLAEQGVYVSFEEFRASSPIVRGSESFTVSARDFDNPYYPPHLERRSSGSRSQVTVARTSLAFLAETALHRNLAYHAHSVAGAEHVLWLTAPWAILVQHVRERTRLAAWFYPTQPLPWKIRAGSLYMRLMARLLGHQLPAPVWIDPQDVDRLAAWLAEGLAAGRSLFLHTFSSSAVRVAAAARDRGHSLRGLWIGVTGEPFTEGKKRVFDQVGARALVNFRSTETGLIGYGCVQPVYPDDVHLSSDALALIQRATSVGGFGVSVPAFLFTSLLPSASKILLNYESGDFGSVERRDCGCALGTVGLRDHISNIQSYEKLSSEGTTFVRSRLQRVLEELLPDRFGGSGADYQLLEEEDTGGIGRLVLLVHPRLGELNPEQVKQALLAELAQSNELEQQWAKLWERAETVEIRRESPRSTKTGKVPSFYVSR